MMVLGHIFSRLEFPPPFGYYSKYTGVLAMMLAELGAPIADLLKKIDETWRRL
jgi:hypothetical protein